MAADRRGRGGPATKVSPARLAAVRVLLAVEEGAHADEALATGAPRDPADRAMTWNLVLGVLRSRPELDAVIVAVARRPLWSLEPAVRNLLRIGIYELRYSRVPPHAAVDQAVEASRRLGVGHAASFVNAVLRRQEGFAVPDLMGHPEWLAERWRARYGSGAELWMRANNQPAPVHIVAKEDPAGVARDFQHRGLTLVPVGEGIFRLPPGTGALEQLPGFDEGRWWVMDPAAVAVADLVPSGDSPVLDTCAAPGGKSFRLASRAGERQVMATDLTEDRLERLRSSAGRLGLPVRAQVHDWTAGPLLDDAGQPVQFSAVLVDAPCTGLGLLRRHPDIRWHRKEEDIHNLAERQRRILYHASLCVAPGGSLVYAVCSPEPEEGERVAAMLKWEEEARFSNAPALDGQDVFWGCRMRRPG